MFLAILSNICGKDRSQQYWNAEGRNNITKAGKELLAEVVQLEVIQSVLRMDNNVGMNYNWENFSNHMQRCCISLLSKIHDRRNIIVNDASGTDATDENIDDMLVKSLIDDFTTIPALSETFHTEKRSRLDPNNELNQEQRILQVEMLVQISSAEYRESKGVNDITSETRKYGKENLKTKMDINDTILSNHATRASGGTVTPKTPKTATGDTVTKQTLGNIQAGVESVLSNRSSSKNEKANKEAQELAINDLNDIVCYSIQEDYGLFQDYCRSNYGKMIRLDQFNQLSKETKLNFVNKLRPGCAFAMKNLFNLN